MTAGNPLFPDEKLELIAARQPFVGRKFEQSRAIAATAALPGAAVVMHDLTFPHPNLSPLYTGIHHVVTVSAINCLEGVFKFDGGFNGL